MVEAEASERDVAAPAPARTEDDRKSGKETGRETGKGGALGSAETLLAGLVAGGPLPPVATVTRLREALKAERQRFETEEGPIGREVASVSASADAIRLAFDERERPTRTERLVGTFSGGAMLRHQERRFARQASPARFADLIGQGHSLQGRLGARRAMLIGKRKLFEGGIAALAGRRAAISAALALSEKGLSPRHAALRVEQVFSLLEGAVALLNRRIGDVNVMIHKLVFEIEDLLVFYRASEEASGISHPLEAERHPHIAPALQRLADGRLVAIHAQWRKPAADAVFRQRFSPPPAPAEPVRQPASTRERLKALWLAAIRPSRPS